VFGIIRPCRHSLDDELRAAWWSHLCGLCLALRDEHGQLARVVTNFDGLVVSALLDAQLPAGSRRSRRAGLCPLRGFRGASVAVGPGARLAATASLLLAAAKLDDHAADGDAAPPLARRLSARWSSAGSRTAANLGFDATPLLGVATRQSAVEAAAPDDVLAVTRPAEDAAATVFRHTAVLAGRPVNAEPLAEVGRLFGRVAHLVDAVQDLAADTSRGAWNPLTATGTSLREARRLCDDAVLGVELALREAELDDPSLVHRLLVHELRAAVGRAFASAEQPQPARRRGRLGVWIGAAGGCCGAAVSAATCGICCGRSANAAGEGCGEACGSACNEACGSCTCGQTCAQCGQTCDGCGQTCNDCGDSCGSGCDSCGSGCSGCGDSCGSSCSGCGDSCSCSC
jgi:Family of unknown function (DUF5685)